MTAAVGFLAKRFRSGALFFIYSDEELTMDFLALLGRQGVGHVERNGRRDWVVV